MRLTLFFVAILVWTVVVSEHITDKDHVARYAVATLGNHYKLIRIKSVQRKDAGSIYHIRVKIRNRVPGKGKRRGNCDLDVWERPDGSIQVLDHRCRF